MKGNFRPETFWVAFSELTIFFLLQEKSCSYEPNLLREKGIGTSCEVEREGKKVNSGGIFLNFFAILPLLLSVLIELSL